MWTTPRSPPSPLPSTSFRYPQTLFQSLLRNMDTSRMGQKWLQPTSANCWFRFWNFSQVVRFLQAFLPLATWKAFSFLGYHLSQITCISLTGIYDFQKNQEDNTFSDTTFESGASILCWLLEAQRILQGMCSSLTINLQAQNRNACPEASHICSPRRGRGSYVFECWRTAEGSSGACRSPYSVRIWGIHQIYTFGGNAVFHIFAIYRYQVQI